MSGLKRVTIDRRAQKPLSPIKPKKGPVILLSLVAGLTLGVLVAPGRHLILARREAIPYSQLDEHRLALRPRKDDEPKI